MRLHLPAALVLVSGLAIAASACGATYADKCALACELPEGPCASEDAGQCQSDCEVATEGLEVACAQCITERSGWKWRECVDGCLVYRSSASGSEGGGCDPCTESDEQCTDFEIEEASSSACEDVCGAESSGGSDETGSP
ncbi:MAG: hypothetical protein JNK04_13895 [Myxococcales bacterium]|nr:hypothetical protein [Myxococcales bacterium]